MPWCDDCSKYWTYSSLPPEGTCPTCGRALAKPERPAGPVTAESLDLREMAGEKAKVPWHFKLMLVALIIYLGWRFVQLILLLF
jgi:hypothetical protein